MLGRDEEVALVARGPSNDEIGDALSISPFTVKTRVNRAMAKLDAHDRAQLVVFAYQAELLRPDERAPTRTPRRDDDAGPAGT